MANSASSDRPFMLAVRRARRCITAQSRQATAQMWNGVIGTVMLRPDELRIVTVI